MKLMRPNPWLEGVQPIPRDVAGRGQFAEGTQLERGRAGAMGVPAKARGDAFAGVTNSSVHPIGIWQGPGVRENHCGKERGLGRKQANDLGLFS